MKREMNISLSKELYSPPSRSRETEKNEHFLFDVIEKPIRRVNQMMMNL